MIIVTPHTSNLLCLLCCIWYVICWCQLSNLVSALKFCLFFINCNFNSFFILDNHLFWCFDHQRSTKRICSIYLFLVGEKRRVCSIDWQTTSCCKNIIVAYSWSVFYITSAIKEYMEQSCILYSFSVKLFIHRLFFCNNLILIYFFCRRQRKPFILSLFDNINTPFLIDFIMLMSMNLLIDSCHHINTNKGFKKLLHIQCLMYSK
jgi:hypothetical protein